jgi:hypothetical protein
MSYLGVTWGLCLGVVGEYRPITADSFTCDAQSRNSLRIRYIMLTNKNGRHFTDSFGSRYP